MDVHYTYSSVGESEFILTAITNSTLQGNGKRGLSGSDRRNGSRGPNEIRKGQGVTFSSGCQTGSFNSKNEALFPTILSP